MKEITFDDLPDDPNHPLIKQGARQRYIDINFDDLPNEKPSGFIDNVSQDLSNRIARQKEINAATATQPNENQQNPFRGAWQTGTNIMGAANDVLGEGIKSLSNIAYDKFTTQGFKDRQALGLDVLGKTNAGTALSGLKSDMQRNSQAFKIAYPNFARDVEGLGDASAFLIPGGTGTILKGSVKSAPKVASFAMQAPYQVVKKTGQGVGEIARDIIGKEKITIPSVQEMKTKATNSYKLAEEEGALLPEDFMQSFADNIKNVNPQSDIASDLIGESAGSKLNQIFSKYADKPLDMKTIDEIDKALTRKAQDSWKDNVATNDTRDILEIQSRFRNAIKESEPQKGLTAWNNAKSEFFTSKQLEDIQNIFDHAKRMPQEATAIQSGARNLIESSRFKSFSPEAQKYLEKMASQSLGVDALKMMGSRLLPLIVGGSGGGMANVAATAIGGSAARKGAARVLAYQGEKAKKAVFQESQKRAKEIEKLSSREAQMVKIAEQSEVPIEVLVELADENIKELAQIVGKKGNDTAFAQALRIAIKNKGKK